MQNKFLSVKQRSSAKEVCEKCQCKTMTDGHYHKYQNHQLLYSQERHHACPVPVFVMLGYLEIRPNYLAISFACWNE